MRWLSASVVALTILCGRPAFAQSDAPDRAAAAPEPRPITFDGRYVIDLIGVAAGGEARQTDILDNLELTADADLSRLVAEAAAAQAPDAAAGSLTLARLAAASAGSGRDNSTIMSVQ